MNHEILQAISPDQSKSYRIASLLVGFINGTITKAENDELDEWVMAGMANQHLFEQIIDEKNQAAWLKLRDEFDAQAALQRIKKKVTFTPPPPVKRSGTSRTFVMVLTGIVIFLLVLYWFFIRRH